ncbi:MAG: helix-turn-helix domain-containing protein, partial [Ligilactobacillus ruminis]|nr:helix-turn-helix domain-containing protein [Ligilactobacillus ruminis]
MEKKIHCTLGGHFHMGRKSKYSADFKLMIIHEAETLGI